MILLTSYFSTLRFYFYFFAFGFVLFIICYLLSIISTHFSVGSPLKNVENAVWSKLENVHPMLHMLPKKMLTEILPFSVQISAPHLRLHNKLFQNLLA